MTEKQLRQKYVDVALSYLGCKESNGTHKPIIDIYNSVLPHPRGYKMKYTDAWCATYVTAMGIQAGMSDIILRECGCEAMIKLYRNAGRWIENDAYVPTTGDIIFYDWQDNGIGDNVGGSDHVGIVVSVNDDIITVVEGNCSDSVKKRTILVNGKCIRGFAIPDYAGKATEKEPIAPQPTPTPTPAPKYSLTDFVKEVQTILGIPATGVCNAATFEKTATLSATINNRHPLVKPVQKYLNAIGYTQVGTADGIAGPKFTAAVKAYQNKNCGYADGEITAREKTWRKLLGCEGYEGIVTAYWLNMRKGPGTSYGIIKALKKDTKVHISDEKNGWGYIDGAGWVSLKYIKKV